MCVDSIYQLVYTALADRMGVLNTDPQNSALHMDTSKMINPAMRSDVESEKNLIHLEWKHQKSTQSKL